jgi:zinc protease
VTTLTQRALDPVRQVLDNGLVVMVRQARTTPAVTIQAAIRAGSLYDPDDQLGLAHFLSRTIDRGTSRRSADQIAEELDSRGVSWSIGTTRHQLTISCTCLSEDFDHMIDLLGDVVMRPTFPEDQVIRRRGEIITNIRQDEDNPAVVAVEGLMALLYPAPHPYGRRARGTVASVESVDSASLEGFYRRRFSPVTVSLVVVGDVEHSQVIESASRIFRDWKNEASADTTVSTPVSPSARRTEVFSMMNKAQADIAYGFVAATRADPAFYALWIMNHALGQYALGGRLGDSIRERQGMAYYVFSSLDANIGAGPLVIRAGVNPANVDRAIQSIDEELRSALSPGFTERDVQESRQYLIGSLPRNLETNAGVASFLQAAEFFNLGLDYDRRLPSLLEAVTLDDVWAAARLVLDPERATVVVAGPYAVRLQS